MDDIVKRILTLMEEKNISAYQVAKNCNNISNGNISGWKTDKSKPGVNAIIQLAKYLGVTTDYLLGLEPPPQKPQVPIELAEIWNSFNDGEQTLAMQYIKTIHKLKQKQEQTKKIN